MSAALAEAANQIATWRRFPAQMVWDLFGVEPDAWQLDTLEAFASPSPDAQRIAMQACAGPGKSAALAWCGWNFLLCYGDTREHPKGAAVSITGDNLRDNLWAEFAKWQGQSPLLQELFTWTKQRIFANDHPETWWLSARSFAKTADPEEQGRTLSGLHSQYILYLIDESGDIPPAVLRAAEQGIGNTTFGKILQAGNPTSHTGMLRAAATTLRHQWRVIQITGDPDDPKRSPRIDIDWARAQIANYGRDDPWVMAYILGQFPPGGLNSLLGPDDVEAAMQRHIPADVYQASAKIIGVDVADEGGDRTVLFPRQGAAAFAPVVLRGAKGSEVAARIAKAHEKWGADAILIDDTGGWAGRVMQCLDDAGIPYIPVNFAGKALDPRYANRRAEMYFEMAEWVKKGGALPTTDMQLTAELTEPTYSFHQGKFLIEPKDKLKKRLCRSPDLADALALTFAQPVQPTPRGLAGALLAGDRRAAGDFDPWENTGDHA